MDGIHPQEKDNGTRDVFELTVSKHVKMGAATMFLSA